MFGRCSFVKVQRKLYKLAGPGAGSAGLQQGTIKTCQTLPTWFDRKLSKVHDYSNVRNCDNIRPSLLDATCKICHHQQCKEGEQTTARTMYRRTNMATPRPTCECVMLHAQLHAG